MSLPEFASSARHPVAANTVDNILQALLPSRLSSKDDSVTRRTTAAPSHSSDSDSELGGGTDSSGFVLESDDDVFSFGDSEQEEVEAPEHPAPMPTPLTGLWRRSDIMPSLGHNDLEACSFGGSEEEVETPKRREPMPTLLTGLRRSSDRKPPLGNNDPDARSLGGSEKNEVEVPKSPEPMPTLLTGLRRSSDRKPPLGNNDLAARSFGGSDEEEAEAPKRSEPMPTLLTGFRRRSDIKTSQQEQPQRLKANCNGTVHHDVSTAWNCCTAPADNEDKASLDQDPLSYIRLLTPTDFVKFLKAHNVPVEHYSQGKARCLQDLWAEVVTGECKLQRLPCPTGLGKCLLQRSVKVLVLEVKAIIEGKQRFLVLKEERNALGHIRHHLDYRVTKKVFDDEDVPAAIHRCLLQNLGIESGFLEEVFAIESAEEVEEIRESTAYPGLSTVYSLRLVYMRVRDISQPKMAAIGLPSGSTFTTKMMGSAFGVDKWRTWSWRMPDTMEVVRKSNQGMPTGQGRARPS